MKYIYRVRLNRENECVYDGPPETIVEDYCSNYIKAMEAANDAMKIVGRNCFIELYDIDKFGRRAFGCVRAWKAIADGIYVVSITKIELDKERIKRLLR